MKRFHLPVLCVMMLAASQVAAQDWQDKVRAAKSGQTVELPAGELKGGVMLPAGVSLKGAGVGKTILDATGKLNGVVIAGGAGAQVSDLTIRNAQGAGVAATDAERFTLARVRVTASSTGISFKNVQGGRIENCISDQNSFGIAVTGGEGCTVVNCTILNCPELGLSLAASPQLVVFNNCIVGSALCLNIDEPSGKHIDHNLYFGALLAQMKEQSPKRQVWAWNYLTGLDAHSVTMPVDFQDLTGGNFTPTNLLSWSQERAATSDWGVQEFAGVKAPATDIAGRPREGRPDVGTVEVPIKPARTADGEFVVSNDVGLKSAGVFTKDGLLISYLFQNLPLPKGKHAFWLPPRDHVGQPIHAGDYDVRLAESDFQWKYLNHVGDNGGDRPMPYSASFNPKFVAFAPNGILVMQEGPSEDHAGLRGFDATTGKLRWYKHGATLAQGLAVGKDGTIYCMFVHNEQKGESRLTRLDSATGKVIPWPGAKVGHVYPATAPRSYSLTVLGDKLYLANAESNKVFVLSTTDGKVEKTIDVPSPRVVAGDDKTSALWVISGDGLVALSADGAKLAESKAILDPSALAARDGQLAVASGKTGKVHFFDASDPKQLKPIRDFGRGDGPFGAIEPDRFFFQKAAGVKPPLAPPATEHGLNLGEASLALGPGGQFAVAEFRRALIFDGQGKNLWYTIGVFGNQSKPSHSTQNRRLWETDASLSFLMNEKDGTWRPEALWDHSRLAFPAPKDERRQPLGDFSDGDKSFLVIASATCGMPFGPPAGSCDVPVLTVARLDDFKSVPVLTVTLEGDKFMTREDTNGDGAITSQDTGQPLVDASGKPLPPALFQRFNYLEPDGNICVMQHPPMIWKRAGLSAKGVPVYDGKNFVAMLDKDWKNDVSPYDFKPDYTTMYGGLGFVVPGRLSDGGWVFQAAVRGSGGSYMNNGAGTDLCGYGPDGRRRWVMPLAQHRGIAGMGTVDDITVTSIFYAVENMVADADGLGLGGFCEPQQLHYAGYWIDHPNLRVFKLPDNKIHVSYGDNSSGRHPWYRLDNQESLKRTKQPFRVAAERASELAALESKPVAIPSVPPRKFRIPRLAQPLAIDGDLEKWRKAGVQPQIVVRPSGAFDGPGDCSAVIRMAYEGQNLYFQILQFDDVPMFYQMIFEDNVELAINGAADGGFQFVAYKDAEGQDIIWRNRFFANLPQIKLDPKHAPRMIKVLPNAEAVPERETLEALYGTDLSKAKVIVTEFKLPIDKDSYAGSEKDIVELGPGKSFWIGFFIDDNDDPFTDKQELSAWPATFGVFSAKEEGAMAICE